MKNSILSTLVGIALIGSASQSKADIFGTGGNQFTLDFTTIGNAGNAADTTGYGAVGYNYRIGTYDISQNQIDSATANGLQGVTGGAWSGDQPAANMTWYESAAFVNWLNTSKGFQPAYNLTWSGSTWSMALWTVADAGYDANNLYRNSLAKYFLPSENEFYKAAYGKSDGSGYYLYPTSSDSMPTAVTSGTAAGTAVFSGNIVNPQVPASVYEAGGLSSYGTMGQGGNIWGWEESAYDGVNDSSTQARGVRGGLWSNDANALRSTVRDYDNGVGGIGTGFRVASVQSVPEPSTYALLGIGLGGVILVVRRRRVLV